MGAQSTQEQEVRDMFAATDFGDFLGRFAEHYETDAVRWLRNVRIPPSDEGEGE